MRLSEAMRKGITLTKPVKRVFLHENAGDGIITHSCALGACYVGVEGVDGGATQISEWLSDRWPELDSYAHRHPNSSCHVLENIIFDLNDEKGLSREEIAAWLESEGL